jgi:hypothetical protein
LHKSIKHLNLTPIKKLIEEKMKSFKNILSVLLIVAVSVSFAKEEKYGKDIATKTKTAVSIILQAPAKYEGKTVLVEGEVLAVCQSKGCWIEVAGEKEGEKIKVKVEDGVIIFPQDAKGKKALVEGTLEEVKPEMSCGDHEKEKTAENKDKKEDEAGCCSASKTAKVYQIRGLGAVIK